MLNLNGSHLLRVAMYFTSVRFADIDEFSHAVLPVFRRVPYRANAATRAVRTCRSRLARHSPSPSMRALQILLREELSAISENLSRAPATWEPVKALDEFAKSSVLELEKLGLGLEVPPVNIVRKFPAPFGSMPWEAFCPDASDERLHGIPQGVYFKEAQLQPLYTEYVLGHEMLHFLIGQKQPELLGRGLEEGLCELLGSLYLSLRIRGADFARSIYSLSQLSYKLDPFWEIYTDYTRQAFAIYLTYGLDAIAELIRRGRGAIKTVEQRVLDGRLLDLDLPKGTWPADFSTFGALLLMSRPRTLAVSPLAFYIARFVEPGATPQDIAAAAQLEVSAVRSALKELQERVFVILARDGQPVDASDTKMLLSTRTLRYRIPKTRLLHRML